MKIAGFILLALIAACIGYVFIMDKRHQRRDRRFLDQLRTHADILKLRAAVFKEMFSGVDSGAPPKCTSEETELLVGRGFLMPVNLMVALYSPAVLQGPVDGVTWSIPFDRCEAKGDSLIVECALPSDEDGFTRLTYKGLLVADKREAILGALGISQENAAFNKQP